jgi:hypothetical protein
VSDPETELTTDELAALAPPADATLSEVQRWMTLLLRHRKGLAKSEAMQKAASLHFSGNAHLSPAEQIDIYRGQFWLRHTGVLVEDFPGVANLLGQRAWERIAESYLTRYGYKIFALKDLGRDLPAHLAAQEDLVAKELLVDMARLEWAYASVFDVRDDPILSRERLAEIPPAAWAGARFELSNALRLLKVSYPVADLRRQLKEDPMSVPNHTLVEREEQNLVVYRRDGSLWDKSISRAAFLLLAEFQKGAPLIPACEAVVREDPSTAAVFDEKLVQWFGLWGQLGWITAVHIDEASGPAAS